MGDPDYGLRPDQLNEIYEQQIFPALSAGVAEAVTQPTVVFLAGAPGAGKSAAADRVPKLLGGERPMALNADLVRHFHPDYRELMGINPGLAVEVSTGAVDYWLRRLRIDATIIGSHIVDETTLRRPELFLDVARDLKQFDYRVEAQILATHPQISSIANIARTEAQIQQTGSGRIVPLDYHDHLVANLAGAGEQINAHPGLIDSLKVTTRHGTVLWEGPATPGPGATIRAELSRPLTIPERKTFSDAVGWVRTVQHQRGAGTAERHPVERVAQRNTPPIAARPNPTTILQRLRRGPDSQPAADPNRLTAGERRLQRTRRPSGPNPT